MEFALADGFLMGPVSLGVSAGDGEAGLVAPVGAGELSGEAGLVSAVGAGEPVFDVSVFAAHAASEKIIRDTNNSARSFFIFILLLINIMTSWLF